MLPPSHRCKQRLPGDGRHRDQSPLSAASPRCACRAIEGEQANAIGPRKPANGSRVGDALLLPELLNQIPANQLVGKVSADGACDKLPDAREMARDVDRQVAEPQIRAAILNRFAALGTPQTDRVG